MSKFIYCFILLIYSTSSIAQDPEVIRGNGYWYSKVTGINSDHVIDSLIKIAPERSIIVRRRGGDIDYSEHYAMYYVDGSLKCISDRNVEISDKVKWTRANAITDSSLYCFGKYYTYMSDNAGSGVHNYNYLLVLGGEIVEGLVSNVPISMISDERLKNEMKLFTGFF